MLNPNLAGTKANFHFGRHIWQFKMAAIEIKKQHFKQYFCEILRCSYTLLIQILYNSRRDVFFVKKNVVDKHY